MCKILVLCVLAVTFLVFSHGAPTENTARQLELLRVLGIDLHRMKQASKIISEEFYTITDTGSRDIKCRISALCCFVRELYDLEKYLRNLPEYAVYTNNTIINAVEFLKQLDASYSEKTKDVQYLEDQCEICDAPTTTKNIEGFVEDFEALLKNLATNL